MAQSQKTQGEALLTRKNGLESRTNTKRKRSTKNPANTNGNTRLTQRRKTPRQSLGKSLRNARSENERRISLQPQQIPSEALSQNPLAAAALPHPEGGVVLWMTPSGDPFRLKKEALARRMKVEVVAVPKNTGGNTRVSLQLPPASEELAPNGTAGLAIGAGQAVEMRRVMVPHHTGCIRSLHPSTVRRTRKRRIRAASIPGAAPDLAGTTRHTDPLGVLTPVARLPLLTRAAIAGSTVTRMTATVTTAIGHEGTPSVPMTRRIQTMPAPSIGPNDTSIHPPMMTTASAAASPEAALGVIPGSDRGPGAAAAAAVVVVVGASEEAAALQLIAGSGAGATAGIVAGAPGALPRDLAPERDRGVMRAPRRGVLGGGTSFAPRSTVPSPPTISAQAEEKVLGRKMMAEETTVKGQDPPLQTASLTQEGDQKATVALKTKTQSLPDCS